MNTPLGIPPAPALGIPTTPAPAVQGQPAEAPVEVNMADAVLKYRQLRDKKKEIQDRHKAELEPYNTVLDQLEILLLAELNKTGVESMRTLNGTAFKTTKTTYKIEDPAELRDFITANGLTDMYENRISTTALEDYLQRGGTLPPGISVNSFVSVNVRKA